MKAKVSLTIKKGPGFIATLSCPYFIPLPTLMPEIGRGATGILKPSFIPLVKHLL